MIPGDARPQAITGEGAGEHAGPVIAVALADALVETLEMVRGQPESRKCLSGESLLMA